MNQQAARLPIFDSFARPRIRDRRSARLSPVWSTPKIGIDTWARSQARWLMFSVAAALRVFRFVRYVILRIVQVEQKLNEGIKQMNNILWDVSAGNPPFRSVTPGIFSAFFEARRRLATEHSVQTRINHDIAGTEAAGGLGRTYRTGTVILRQGETGDAMFVIQAGSVELVRETDGHELSIAELSAGEFFGEMALFEQNIRITVRALTDVRLITVDRWLLLRKINQDPTLAFRIMNSMAGQINKLTEQCMYLSRARLETAMLHLEQDRNP